MSDRRQWIFRDTLNQGFILRGYEEDDDIVIMIIHESNDEDNIVRFDQSPHLHTVFHSHIYGGVYEEFPAVITKEQKIETSINKIKDYILTGLVNHNGQVYTAAKDISHILEKYKQTMLSRSVEKGVIQGSAVIRATAATITLTGNPSYIRARDVSSDQMNS